MKLTMKRTKTDEFELRLTREELLELVRKEAADPRLSHDKRMMIPERVVLVGETRPESDPDASGPPPRGGYPTHVERIDLETLVVRWRETEEVEETR